MDFYDIQERMTENRYLADLSSVPFIVLKDGIKNVIWFYYRLEKADETAAVNIKKIMSTINGQQVEEEETSICEKLVPCDHPLPEITEADYYKELGKIYEDYSEEKMKETLQKAVLKPTYQAYLTVIDHCTEKEPELILTGSVKIESEEQDKENKNE